MFHTSTYFSQTHFIVLFTQINPCETGSVPMGFEVVLVKKTRLRIYKYLCLSHLGARKVHISQVSKGLNVPCVTFSRWNIVNFTVLFYFHVFFIFVLVIYFICGQVILNVVEMWKNSVRVNFHFGYSVDAQKK